MAYPRVINLTGHPVRMLGQNGTILADFPVDNANPNVIPSIKEEFVKAGIIPLPSRNVNMPVYLNLHKSESTQVVNLPSVEPDTFYIVNSVIFNNTPTRQDLVTPIFPFRNPNNPSQIMGYRGLRAHNNG